MIGEYKHILAAVDGSEEAEVAYGKAVAIAKRNKAKLFVAHVMDDSHLRFNWPHTLNRRIYDKAYDQTKEEAENMLQNYKQQAEKEGLKEVEVILKVGTPKQTLSQEIPQEKGIDLIIVGATGLGAVDRLLIGSVTEHIIRSVECDVLVVRRPLGEKSEA